jgi:hypothetical protein
LFTDGSLEELDGSTIDCGSKAVNQFQLKVIRHPDYYWYIDTQFNYKCAAGDKGPVDGGHQEYTAWTRGVDKGLNYLDRHFLKCPEHEFITHFDEEVKNNDIRFNYRCKKWSPAHDYQCHDKSTEWNPRGLDDTLIFLDRHNVQCGANEGLNNPERMVIKSNLISDAAL